MIEELADILMYYNDILLCYDISSDELKSAYVNKEYMTVNLSVDPSFDVHVKLDRYIVKLNEYGKQGWNLISGMDDWKYLIFER